MGYSMSKQGEKRLMSKNNIFMKKYERILGIYMVYAFFGINLVFWTILDLFSKFSKKDQFQKVNNEKEKKYYSIWCHWT